MNEFYDHVNAPPTGSQLSSALLRAEFDKVEAGFDKLPLLSTGANKLVAINASSTALVATDAPDINGGTIDGASIGAVDPKSGAFTTLSSTSTTTAPTAAVDTNSTHVATTEFVLGQASSAAPVMDGVAAAGASTRWAKGDHVHPTDTTRAPTASPTFTGTVTIPTAATGTNTTQAASTAFVLAQAATTTPVMDGIGTIGSLPRFAKADHIHPTDTSRAPTASPTFTGTVTLPNTGTGANEAATKAYVDVVAVGIDTHASCQYATTGNINTSTNGLTAVDGTVLMAGRRILVKNQTTSSQNGIYVANVGAWARAVDADIAGEIRQGSYVFVESGTVNAKTGWTQQTSGIITPGTTAMLWTQFSSSQTYTAGTGLSLAGQVFNISTVPAANGGTGATTTTGTGANVLATSPTLVTPILGTPTSATLTNATGLPLTSGVTGTLSVLNGGTGVTTAQEEMNRVAAAVTSGKYLRGNGTNVVMSAIQAADVPILNQSTTGNATTATTATKLAAGLAGQIPWQSAASTTGFTAAGTAGQALLSGGATVPTWGTLGVGAGGTGATSLTSGGLLRGNGTSAISVATAADIVAAIGVTAVANATTATTATSAGSATIAAACSGNATTAYGKLESSLSVGYAATAGSAPANGGTSAALNGTNAQQSGDGWWRSTGTTGWYSTSYDVGIYATEAGNVRTYNGANFIAAGSVTGLSDERLKKNWRDLGINFIPRLAKVKYGIYERIDYEKTQVGVSAQSLQELLPEAILTDCDGMLSVAYGNAALAACIELAKEVTALRAEINQLKGI